MKKTKDWDAFVQAHAETYTPDVVRLAEGWATAMEGSAAGGFSPVAFADLWVAEVPVSILTATVSLLRRYWVHGAELGQWWREYQRARHRTGQRRRWDEPKRAVRFHRRAQAAEAEAVRLRRGLRVLGRVLAQTTTPEDRRTRWAGLSYWMEQALAQAPRRENPEPQREER